MATIKKYSQDPEGFKSAWLGENNKKGIRIEFPEFKERVRPVGTENPEDLHWYEHNKMRGKYVLTHDHSVVADKQYFVNAAQPLIYTDETIENDSFSFKKSIQNGNSIDFIGCISSSVKFKVYNDFNYLKDQKMTVTLLVTVEPGNLVVTGPLGTFKADDYGIITEWPVRNPDCRNEINTLGSYNARFIPRNGSLEQAIDYRQYLRECDLAERGLEAEVILGHLSIPIQWEMKIFTGLVDETKLDKSRSLTREITAYDFLHKLADDYEVTDWYVWQYGDSNINNANVNIQKYSSHTPPHDYFPFEGQEGIFYVAIDTGMAYEWKYYPTENDIKYNPITPSGDENPASLGWFEQINGTYTVTTDTVVISGKQYYDEVVINTPNGDYVFTGETYDTATEGKNWVRTHTIKQLRNTFWEYIKESGTRQVYDSDTEKILLKDEGFGEARNQNLINDDIVIPKTLNVSPVDYDASICTDRIGGPFSRTTMTDPQAPTDYDHHTISVNWDVKDLVCRKEVIELGLVGTLFSYNGKTNVSHREYMDDCDKVGYGIIASIDIPKQIQEKVRETQITAMTVLQAICQFNGVFGQFNADGEFEYIKLKTTNPIEIEDKYQIEVGYSDSRMPNITGVLMFDKTSEEYSADNIHTEYGEVKNGKKGSALAYYPDDRSKITGPDSHAYIMDDNFLLNSYNQKDAIEIAKRIYDQVSNLNIRNANLTIKAMPWLQCGRSIFYYAPTENTLYPMETLAPSESLYPMDYEKISSLIMSYEISGTGLLKEKIECKVEDLSSQIVNLNEVISAEMFYRKIGDGKTYSEFMQTANEIKLSVTDRERDIMSYIDLKADQITLAVGKQGSRIDITENEIKLQSQKIELLANDISLNAQTIEAQANQIRIQANDIDFLTSGKVSFTDLSTGGRTVISGDNITTGKIDGKYIKANSISCDRITLGSISVDGRTYNVDWVKGQDTLIMGTKTVGYRNTNDVKLPYGDLKTYLLSVGSESAYDSTGHYIGTFVTSVKLFLGETAVTQFKLPENYENAKVLVGGASSGNYTVYGHVIQNKGEDHGDYSAGIQKQNLVMLGSITNA